MSIKRSQNREIIRRTAAGALLAATASVLLLIGGLFEILDMSAAALASVAVLMTYLEFGTKTAFAVYGVSSVLALILYPAATSTVYYVLLMGYFPIFKLIADKKLKNKKVLRIISKAAVFNAGCVLILYLFFKISGAADVMAELSVGGFSPKVVIVLIFALLNVFLVLYDALITSLSVIYKKVLRKKIFPKG